MIAARIRNPVRGSAFTRRAEARPRRTGWAALTLILAPLALLAGCDPTTVVDDHPEAEGFVITSGDTELVRWMRDDPQAELTLDVATVYDLVVTMLDENGAPLAHEHEGEEEEEEVVVTIANPSIATWTPETEAVGHEHEHVEAHGELETLATGTTQMTICLEHGTHCDFERDVQLIVQ